MHSFQNIAHLLRPKIQFGHFQEEGGGGSACSYSGINLYFWKVTVNARMLFRCDEKKWEKIRRQSLFRYLVWYSVLLDSKKSQKPNFFSSILTITDISWLTMLYFTWKLWNIIVRIQQVKIKWEDFPNFWRIYFLFVFLRERLHS